MISPPTVLTLLSQQCIARWPPLPCRYTRVGPPRALGAGAPTPVGLEGRTSAPGQLEGRASTKEDYLKSRSKVISPTGFWSCWDPQTCHWPFPSFLFLPFGMGMSILCFSHHCILKAYSLFDFAGSQLERNLSQVNHTLSFTHIWFLSYVDKILDFRLLSWCWKEMTLGTLGREWTCSGHFPVFGGYTLFLALQRAWWHPYTTVHSDGSVPIWYQLFKMLNIMSVPIYFLQMFIAPSLSAISTKSKSTGPVYIPH